jgi:ribonuclease P/MRP protein subunit POP3
VPLNVQNMILAQTVELLAGVNDYTINRKLAGRKRKRQTGKSTAIKVPRTDKLLNDTAGGVDADHATSTANDSPFDPPQPPRITSHVLFGINEVTKRLEKQLDVAKKSSVSSSRPAPICAVFACIEDLETPILLSHLPQLIAACNSTGAHKDRSPLKLVPLPKGAESTLANASGLRRTSVIAFEVRTSVSTSNKNKWRI